MAGREPPPPYFQQFPALPYPSWAQAAAALTSARDASPLHAGAAGAARPPLLLAAAAGGQLPLQPQPPLADGPPLPRVGGADGGAGGGDDAGIPPACGSSTATSPPSADLFSARCCCWRGGGGAAEEPSTSLLVQYPYGMPPWTPTPSGGNGTSANRFPAPPPPAFALTNALAAARAEYKARQARLREAALAWECERDAADALAKQIANAEQLLAFPAAHNGRATSSGSTGAVAGAGPRTSSTTTALWHDPADPLVA